MIWYNLIGFAGLRRVTLSRSATALVVRTVVPPSLAEAIKSGRFPA